MFLTEQISLAFFDNHFCQTLFNTEHLKVSFIGTEEKLATPLGSHVFGWIRFFLAIFVKGHPVIISTKSFCILTTGFRGEDFQSFCCRDKSYPMAAMFFDGSNFF